MIVIEIKLTSAISRDRDEELGTMVIDNITDREKLRGNGGAACDYRCRMYAKGQLRRCDGDARKMVATRQHTREGVVQDHRRHAEPVQNLVAKALTAMGYR
jgi:hypothetical protein